MTRTVLTVDDSRTMRDMLRLCLSHAGYAVTEAVAFLAARTSRSYVDKHRRTASGTRR